MLMLMLVLTFVTFFEGFNTAHRQNFVTFATHVDEFEFISFDICDLL